jgi:hypothetical protein
VCAEKTHVTCPSPCQSKSNARPNEVTILSPVKPSLHCSSDATQCEYLAHTEPMGWQFLCSWLQCSPHPTSSPATSPFVLVSSGFKHACCTTATGSVCCASQRRVRSLQQSSTNKFMTLGICLVSVGSCSYSSCAFCIKPAVCCCAPGLLGWHLLFYALAMAAAAAADVTSWSCWPRSVNAAS